MSVTASFIGVLTVICIAGCLIMAMIAHLGNLVFCRLDQIQQEIDEIKKDTNIILNDIVATNRYLVHLQEQPR